MTVTFENIPNTKIPGVYTEFDNRSALNGLNQQTYRALVIAQKKSEGKMPANSVAQIFGKESATELAGAGSILENMLHAFIDANNFTELHALALNSPSGATAQKTIKFSNKPQESGSINLYIGGELVRVDVLKDDEPHDIAEQVKRAINAKESLLFEADKSQTTVTLTAKNKGELSNDIDIRLNYNQPNEKTPKGLNIIISNKTNGSGVPNLSPALAALSDTQYHVIAYPYTDVACVDVLEQELASRWEPTRQIEGHAILASKGTVGELINLGRGQNSKHLTILGVENSPTPSFKIAASVAGLVSFHAALDPARPFQSLELKKALPAATKDQFTRIEREQLLGAGIATLRTINDAIQIERLVTTYKSGPTGAPDPSYQDANILFTLSFLRFDFNTYFLNKYPRHKLADDGKRFAADQPIMTPKLGEGEALNRFKLWEEQGLVEDFEQYKNDLIVERNTTDRNRLDFNMFPNLVNGLRIVATKISFIL